MTERNKKNKSIAIITERALRNRENNDIIKSWKNTESAFMLTKKKGKSLDFRQSKDFFITIWQEPW